MSYTAHHPALVSRRRRWPLVLIVAIVVLLIAGLDRALVLRRREGEDRDCRVARA